MSGLRVINPCDPDLKMLRSLIDFALRLCRDLEFLNGHRRYVFWKIRFLLIESRNGSSFLMLNKTEPFSGSLATRVGCLKQQSFEQIY